MKLCSIITSIGLIGIVQSLDMSLYSAGVGVDVGFKAYLKEYVTT
jgi:hypothetical protein